MNILLVNNLYPPHSRGGAEAAVVAEAQALAKLGHNVSVLTTCPFSGLRSYTPRPTDEGGITVYRFFPSNLFWYRNDYRHNAFTRALWHLGVVCNWHANSALKRVIKKTNAQVVHLHNINGMSYWYPRVCDRMKVRTVFTVHAVHYAVPSGVIIRGKKIPGYCRPFSWLMSKVLHSRAVIAAPSEFLIDFYRSRGFFKNQETVVVPNPVGMQGDFTPKERPASVEKLPHTRFLYVGQLETYKGLPVLLAALKKLPDYALYQLDVVGDGTMSPELRMARHANVLVRGKLQGDSLRDAYSNADVLVMPSLCEENAPMVIAEAFAHSLPVIASRIGGIPEMVHDGINGALFDAGNVEELSMQLRRVVDHPEILPTLKAGALESVSRYQNEAITAQLLKYFAK